MPKDLPSPELLRKLLRYEPDTGKLFWLERSADLFNGIASRCPNDRAQRFNLRFANLEAFTAIDSVGYKSGRIFNKTYRAHRISWALHYGKWPNHFIDHINGDRQDNRIVNLRDVPQNINTRNAHRRADNKSGMAGVYQNSRDGKWYAQIGINGKTVFVGSFDFLEDAMAARSAAKACFNYTERHGF